MEFVTISNYYPSKPYYPLAEIQIRNDADSKAGIRSSVYTKEYLDFNKIIGSMLQSCRRKFARNRRKQPFDLPESLWKRPMRSITIFRRDNFLHITSPGAMLTSGVICAINLSWKTWYPLGMPVPGKKASVKSWIL